MAHAGPSAGNIRRLRGHPSDEANQLEGARERRPEVGVGAKRSHWRQRHQASSPSPSWKVAVGPFVPIVAIRTITSAPFSTGWPAPLNGVRSVAVKPGSTALNLILGNVFAYCTVSIETAALLEP